MRLSNHHQSVSSPTSCYRIRVRIDGITATDLCVFDVDRVNGILTLVELADGVTVEEVRKNTEAAFVLAETIGEMESDE